MKKNLPLLYKALILPTFCLILIFSAKATIHEINVSSNSFTPSSINVMVNDTIRWTWVGGTHTTTSLSVPSGASTWDSPMTSSVPTFDYKVTHAGSYTYQCTPHAPNMAGSFTASISTGLSSTSQSLNDVSIYPNPFTNFFQIDLKETGFKEAIITDILGKKIISLELNNKITRIDESSHAEVAIIPKGIYFITLLNQNKDKKTVRIIKSGH